MGERRGGGRDGGDLIGGARWVPGTSVSGVRCGGGALLGNCVVKLLVDDEGEIGDACAGMCERTARTTLLLGLGGLSEPEVGGESA